MGMSTGGNKGGVQSEINVTPLIDVLLVLLIIFLVIMPIMVKSEALEVPRTAEPNVMMEVAPLTVTIKDDLVVVLDDGCRTEVTRQGQFHFPGVRLGSHTVRLLLESLPEDATLGGPSEISVQASRQQRAASASFLVKTEKRPEIRKVFSQKNPVASRRR